MPQLIEHIDAIARQKQRDVLFIRFSDSVDQGGEIGSTTSYRDWESSAVRLAVIEWIDKERIRWCRCGDVAATHSMGHYDRQIYIDVPVNETNSVYQRALGYCTFNGLMISIPVRMECLFYRQFSKRGY